MWEMDTAGEGTIRELGVFKRPPRKSLVSTILRQRIFPTGQYSRVVPSLRNGNLASIKVSVSNSSMLEVSNLYG